MKDMWVIAYTVPAAIFVVFLGFIVNSKIITELEAVSALQPALQYLGPVETALGVFDFFVPALFIGFTVSSVYLASRVPNNLVYLPFSLIFGVMSIYLVGAVSQWWIGFMQNSVIAPYTTDLPLTTALGLNFQYIYAAVWLVLIVVMYKRGQRDTAGSRSVMHP